MDLAYDSVRAGNPVTYPVFVIKLAVAGVILSGYISLVDHGGNIAAVSNASARFSIADCAPAFIAANLDDGFMYAGSVGLV